MNLEGRGIVQWTDALGEERAIAEKEEEGALFDLDLLITWLEHATTIVPRGITTTAASY